MAALSADSNAKVALITGNKKIHFYFFACDTFLQRYGGQFYEIENHVRKLGVPFTIIRLPMFMENLYGQTKDILEVSKILPNFYLKR